MSHRPLRKENNCLNCNAIVQYRFCSVCGQENIVIKESFWSFLRHFFEDLTHYDGKFLGTVKQLLFRPGHVAYEYCKGKRFSYIHPIRLYLFSSTVFFILFFGLFVDSKDIFEPPATYSKVRQELIDDRSEYEVSLKEHRNKSYDSLMVKNIAKIDSLIGVLDKDTTLKNKINTSGFAFQFSNDEESVSNRQEYDSLQASLPKGERDNFFVRRIMRQQFKLHDKFDGNQSAMMNFIGDHFIHQSSKLLYCTLPLFAVLLKLVYIRRKRYFYVQHIVFAVYMYCTFFIVLIVSFVLSYMLSNWLNVDIATYLKRILAIWGLYYVYKSMRVFYEQGTAKTLLKYSIVMGIMFILFMLLFTIFFLYSFSSA